MYPDSQLKQVPVGFSPGNNYLDLAGQYRDRPIGGDVPSPPAPGIASKVSDLQVAVSEIRDLAFKLRGSLGIQQPQGPSGQNVAAGSLADVLDQLRDTLSSANRDFTDVLQHLNS